MKILKMIMALVFCVNIISAQVDSVLDYFPFHIGDTWQYRTERNEYYTVVVGKDTLMPNGKIYRYMGDFGEKHGYYRVDSLTACIYNYADYDTTETITDSLKAKRQDYWGYGYVYDSDYIDTIFSIVTSIKVFCNKNIIPGTPYSHYAKGFGLVYYTWGEEDSKWPLINIYTAELVYAKIGGQEFGMLVAVDKNENAQPQKFFLSQNYPNPFNPTTTITFSTPPSSSPLLKGRNEVGFATLKIYDLLGREVATLVNEKLPPGTHTTQWNASGFPSGVYFYRLSTNGYSETKKLVLMK